jgi:hypothetical protein
VIQCAPPLIAALCSAQMKRSKAEFDSEVSLSLPVFWHRITSQVVMN